MLRAHVLFIQCAISVFVAPCVQAQTHFDACSDGTGNVFNATVIIPTASSPTVDGTALPDGSEIAVFSQDNDRCAGVVTWNSANTALTVWGDDPLTTLPEGLQADDVLRFKVWNPHTGTEYTGSTVQIEYVSGNGRYTDDALYVLDALRIDTRPPEGQVIGETGILVKNQPHSDAWHTVPLLASYDTPVVILTMRSYAGDQPATLRVRRVTASSFQFQIDEWDYIDGAHAPEAIGYLVVEAGTHTLDDGRRLQAGLTNAGTNPTSVAFGPGFADVPVVLSQVVSANDPDAVVTRQQQPTRNHVTVYLQGQEATPNHGNETVAWVALEAGTGRTGNRAYEAAVTDDVVTDAWQGFSFSHSFRHPPVLLAAMQHSRGDDTAGLRFQNVTPTRMEMKVEEEQSKDFEMTHAAEAIGYAAFEAGLLSATPASTPGNARAGDKVATQQAAYVLQGNYPNPFNPETVIRYGLTEQVAVRLEVYNAIGQRVAVLVDQVQAAGVHTASFDGSALPNGLYFYRLRAGSFEQTESMILAK